MEEGIQVFDQSELSCTVKKEGENKEEQDCMGSIFNIDVLPGLRSLSLVMNEIICRKREAIFTGNTVRCRGIGNVALVPDDNMGLRGERGPTSPLLPEIH